MASNHPHVHSPNPSSANPDEMIDLEILQLQEELQRIRKQRALLQLRSEIATEQRLLAEAQQNLGLARARTPATERPPVVEIPRYVQQSAMIPPINPTPSSGTGLIRGIKRSHSESSEGNGIEPQEGEQLNRGEENQKDVNGREKTLDRESYNGTANGQEGKRGQEEEEEEEEVPPTFTVKKQFRGANRKEYNLMIDFLESHFAQYECYFAPEERRIEEGLRHVIPELARSWVNCVASGAQTQPTWSGFREFMQSWIKSNVDPAVAIRQYFGRTQRADQTVREFSNHMGSWESHLENLLTEEQRIRNLWERVLPEVSEEAKQFQYQSHRYLEHVAHLQLVESRMPSRSHLQRKLIVPKPYQTKRPRMVNP